MKKMKYISIIIIVVFSIVLSSCNDLLKEDVYGSITSENFWNTVEDAEAVLYSAYSETRGGWQGLSIWQFIIEDVGTDIGTGGYFSTYNYSNYTDWSSTNPDFPGWGIWPPFWQSISYANLVLDKVPDMDIDEPVKQSLMSEARALRAMVYFHLVNWFGGVPVITTTFETPYEIPRQSADSVYNLIISDLNYAKNYLPAKSEQIAAGETKYGRISKHAALALLTKAYLQKGMYTECAETALDIINSGEYQLEENYLDIFSLTNEGYNNSEVIWVMPFIVSDSPPVDGLVLQVYMYRAPEISSYNSYFDWSGDLRSTTNFYNSFESGDIRRDGLYMSSDGLTDPVMLLKYPADPTTDGKYSGNDYPFIRLADVILMRAEALAQLNDLDGAVAEINKVRSRAGLGNIDASGYSKESLLAHILKERRWELYFEGHAKQDMIRLDREGMLDYIKSISEDWERFTAERYLLLPLPSGAMAANPALEQNPDF